MVRALLTLASAHKQSLSESLALQAKMQELGVSPSPGAIIDIAALEIKAKKATPDDALEKLVQYSNEQSASMKKRQLESSMLLFRPAARLLQSLLDAGEYKAVPKAVTVSR